MRPPLAPPPSIGLLLCLATMQGAAVAQVAPEPPPPAAPIGTPSRALPRPLTTSPAWRAAVANGTRAADGRPGPSHWTTRASYRIRAELVPADDRVVGHAELTWHNGSPHEVTELWVHLRQNLYAPGVQRNVTAEVTGGMQLDDIRLDGEPTVCQIDGTRLHCELPQVLAPGASTTLAMDFAFTVPDGEAPRMGRDGHDLYFLGYWYPQFAVFDDVRGWVAEPYLGESEFYMPYADYDVEFTAPTGFLVQATGALQNGAEVLTAAQRAALAQAEHGTDRVRVVTVADHEQGTVTATAESGRLTWRFHAEQVRDFAIATANCWLWDAVRAKVGDRDGDGADDHCLVHTFYRRHAGGWRQAWRFARFAIEHLSQDVLPYPWPHASVVEGILGGGMEYPMMVLCGDQHVPFANQSLIAHELAHEWFPMIVGNDETARGWQDEGVVEYLTAILERDYWRQARGGGGIATYAGIAAAGFDREPLMRHADHLEFGESYYINCYAKPCAVLQQLAGLCGEPRVTAALADYARAWSHRHPTPEDFFLSLQASLGEDLGWYWSTWWFETWRLDHAIAEVRAAAGGGTDVVVEDRGDAPHPATVQVRFADGETAEATVPVNVWLAGARRHTLHFAGEVVRAELDPRGVTVDCDRGNDSWQADR